MKEFIKMFLYPMTMGLFGLWLGNTTSSDRVHTITGTELNQLSFEKEDCEATIPRNQKCKAVITFVVEDIK
ncbi:hypothetical protein [Pseudomonas phage vB_PsaM_M1]|nr:hypothetical protein [Pseudomonas phage vB_PsaM_M1]